MSQSPSHESISEIVKNTYERAMQLPAAEERQASIDQLTAKFRGQELAVFTNADEYPDVAPVTIYRQRANRLFGLASDEALTPIYAGRINWGKQAVTMDTPLAQTGLKLGIPKNKQVFIDTGEQDYSPEPKYNSAVGILSRLALAGTELRTLLIVNDSNKAYVATLLSQRDGAIIEHSHLW